MALGGEVAGLAPINRYTFRALYTSDCLNSSLPLAEWGDVKVRPSINPMIVRQTGSSVLEFELLFKKKVDQSMAVMIQCCFVGMLECFFVAPP